MNTDEQRRQIRNQVASLAGGVLAVCAAWAMDDLGALVLAGLLLVYLGSRDRL